MLEERDLQLAQHPLPRPAHQEEHAATGDGAKQIEQQQSEGDLEQTAQARCGIGSGGQGAIPTILCAGVYHVGRGDGSGFGRQVTIDRLPDQARCDHLDPSVDN